MLLSLFAAASVVLAQPVADDWSFTGQPLTVLSAIRQIDCDEGQGSGWMIADNVMVTARHVATATNCKDNLTGAPLKMYKEDPAKDLALVTGRLPRLGEYIKYSCAGYRPGSEYDVYGWSSFGYPETIFRHHRVVATDQFSTEDEKLRDGTSMPGMRKFKGYTVPGMSGSPYMKDGVAYGIVNVGYSGKFFGIPVVMPKAESYELKGSFLCS